MDRFYNKFLFLLIGGLFVFACEARDEPAESGNQLNLEDLVVYDSDPNMVDKVNDPDKYLLKIQNEYQRRREEFFNLHRKEAYGNIHSALVRLLLNEKPSDKGFIN